MGVGVEACVCEEVGVGVWSYACARVGVEVGWVGCGEEGCVWRYGCVHGDWVWRCAWGGWGGCGDVERCVGWGVRGGWV